MFTVYYLIQLAQFRNFFSQPSVIYNSISSLLDLGKRDVLTNFSSKAVVVVVYKKFYHITKPSQPCYNSLHYYYYVGRSPKLLLTETNHNFKSIFHFMGI